MKVSLNWIKNYVDLEGIELNSLIEKFTLCTAEIEEVIDSGEVYKNIISARIKNIEPHPSIPQLYVASVDIGEKEIKVVTSLENLRVDMNVVVALPGATVNNRKIEAKDFGGIISEGVFCSEKDLELGESMELLELLPNTPVGVRIDVLKGIDDQIIVIDNKSLTHRPDLWGHLGIAREFSAIFDRHLEEVPYIKEFHYEAEIKDFFLNIETPDLCPRYRAIIIDNITIEPSPEWLKNALLSIGTKPINNIVDLSNYVMFELGQPLHTFDYNKIEGGITVRRAKEDEECVLLNGEKIILTKEDIVISDRNKIIALAGVMGCKNSEIGPETKRIVLECANFHPTFIRRTSQRYALRTEAAMRFEKHISPMLVEDATLRFVELLNKIQPQAKIISEIIEKDYTQRAQLKVDISVEYINKKLGTNISKEKIIEILRRLQCHVEPYEDGMLQVIVPHFRATKDVLTPIDIVEEIGRIYGYNNIKPQPPMVEIAPTVPDKIYLSSAKISEILQGYGFDEVKNYSFVSEKELQDFGLDSHIIKLQNPLSSVMNTLRPSLLPGLLKNVYYNQFYFEEFKIFEIGKVFFRDSISNVERTDIGCVVYEKEEREKTFYLLKEIFLVILDNLGIYKNIELKRIEQKLSKYIHPYRNMEMYYRNINLGRIFQLHPQYTQKLELKASPWIMEIDLNNVVDIPKEVVNFQAPDRYPLVPFDIGVVMDEYLEVEEVIKLISEVAPENIRNIEIFDIYKGENLPEGKKSVAFRIKFGSDKGTLTTSEIESLQRKVFDALVNKGFGIR